MTDTTAPERTEYHPAAVAIANWWADKAGVVTGNGDTSDRGGFTTALAVIAGVQGQKIAPSKRDAFVDALARRVTAELARYAAAEWGQRMSVTIGVDYGPDPMLADAAEEAGVPRGAFPWKTMTWTYADHATASLGYRGRSVLVWQAEDWERPVCGASKYSDGPAYERLPWKCSSLIHHDGDHDFSTPQPLCVGTIQRYSERELCNRPETDPDIHAAGSTHPWAHDFKARA